MWRDLSFFWFLRFSLGLFSISIFSLFARVATVHPWMLEPFRSVADVTRPARSRVAAFVSRRRELFVRRGAPMTFGIPLPA